MMVHVFYAAVCSESALALAERIHELGPEVTVHRQKHGPFPYEKNDILVNWGATCPDKLSNRGNWLNRGVYHNKLRQLQALRDHGIPVPKFAAQPGEGEWIARNIAHIDGSDLEQRIKQGDYYVEYVPCKVEYRAHIFRGEALRFSEKRQSTKFLEPGEKIDPKFRIGNGWVFSDRNYLNDVGPKMKQVAIDAVNAVGYDFGGVDIAYTNDGKIVVFEVNSGPWLGGEMQRAYAERIVKTEV